MPRTTPVTKQVTLTGTPKHLGEGLDEILSPVGVRMTVPKDAASAAWLGDKNVTAGSGGIYAPGTSTRLPSSSFVGWYGVTDGASVTVTLEIASGSPGAPEWADAGSAGGSGGGGGGGATEATLLDVLASSEAIEAALGAPSQEATLEILASTVGTSNPGPGGTAVAIRNVDGQQMALGPGVAPPGAVAQTVYISQAGTGGPVVDALGDERLGVVITAAAEVFNSRDRPLVMGTTLDGLVVEPVATAAEQAATHVTLEAIAASAASEDSKTPELVGGKVPVDASGSSVSIVGTPNVAVLNFPATQAVTDNGSSLTVDSPQLPSALVGGRLSVDGSGVTQPVSDAGGSLTVDGAVSITSSVLPTGAATEMTLGTRASEATLSTRASESTLATRASEATAAAALAAVDTLEANTDGIEGKLGTLAAQEATTAKDTSVDGLEALVTAGNASAAAIDAGIPAALGAGGGMKVEGVAGGVAMNVETELSAAGPLGTESTLGTRASESTLATRASEASVDQLEGYVDGVEGAIQRRGVPSDATIVNGSALAASGVILASATTMRTVDVINTSSSDRVVMVFNATSVPANGAVPKWRRLLPKNGSLNWEGAIALSTGFVWALSTTVPTLTLAAADVLVDASYGGT